MKLKGVKVLDSPLALSRWFLALGLLLGTQYALFMAPLRVPDEAGHFYRVYTVSEGYCIGIPATGSLTDWRELDHYPPWNEPMRSATIGDLKRMISNPSPQSSRGLIDAFKFVNLYSCVPYIPSAAAVRVGRLCTSSWLSLMYIGRFTNLGVYLISVLLCLRLLPDFDLTLVCLALMPMALHQAASLSADAMSISVAFVLTSYILTLAFSDYPRTLERRQHLFLGVGVILAALCKGDVWLVLLVLLIPASKFQTRRARWMWACTYICTAFGIMAGWQYLDRLNEQFLYALSYTEGIHVDDNLHFIFSDPGVFVSTVARTLGHLKYEYVEEFIGTLAFLTIRLPSWVTWSYAVMLVCVAVTQSKQIHLLRWHRVLLVSIFLLNAGALFLLHWGIAVPHDVLISDFKVGRGFVSGIQGRYFIPFAFAFLVALSSARLRFSRPSVTAGALAVCLVANVLAIHLIWVAYQARTSTLPNRLRMALHFQFSSAPDTAALRYDHRLVRRPGPKPEDGLVFFISEGRRHWLLDSGWMKRTGYKWPDDVIFVPAADLEAIPLGRPLISATSRYEGQLVRRPGSTPEDQKVYIVRNGAKQWIVDGHWITSHGYRWPDDVKTIPASELDTIPLGDAIQ